MPVQQSPQALATELMLERAEDVLLPTVANVLSSTPSGFSVSGPLAAEFENALVPLILARMSALSDGDPIVAGAFGTGAYLFRVVRESVGAALRRIPGEFPLDDEKPTQPQSVSLARRLVRWVARTALFTAQEQASPSMGFTHKRWITVGDDRVRANHNVLDGRVAKLGQAFHTPGGTIRFPGDQDAPMDLWINCRCHLELLTR